MTRMRETPVGELAKAQEAICVFERHQIDHCCGGECTLEDACREAGVAVEEVVRDLESGARRNEGTLADTPGTTLSELARHIVNRHHAFTRETLDRIAPLVEKVVAVHGERHPELRGVRDLLCRLDEELRPHMMKEECVLFPYVEALERASGAHVPRPLAPFGTVARPVRMMRQEHDAAGELLRALREATAGYRTPPDACVSYGALYQGLEALERDLHQHVHLENNILFPAALGLEDRVMAADAGLSRPAV